MRPRLTLPLALPLLLLLPLLWAPAGALRTGREALSESEEERELLDRRAYHDGRAAVTVLPRAEEEAEPGRRRGAPPPPTLLAWDGQPYALRWPNRTFYSQFKQDETLAPIFRSVKGGFFVESGAQNGEFHSNTLGLEKRGWSGLLVEPCPNFLRSIKGRHRKAHLFEGALSPTGFAEVVQFDGIQVKSGGALKVAAEPLQSLLAPLKQKTVDFWSLDIEGLEGKVLNTTDFRKVEVGVLLVEVAHQLKGRDPVAEVMAREGFPLVGHSYYQRGAWDLADTRPERQWLPLDAVYVNPAYFARRGLRTPTRIDEDLKHYDCRAAEMRRERGKPAAGDHALLRKC